MKKHLLAFIAVIFSFAISGQSNAQVFVYGVTSCGTTPTTIVNGKPAYLTVDTTGKLCDTGSGGGGGTTTVQGNVSNASSAVATTSTNLGTNSYNYGFNGATWDQLQVDSLKNLKVVSLPAPATTTTTNSTIAAGNSFQTALAASGTRKGCLIQNTSSENMYFYFGTLGSATLSNSIQIVSGQSISCNAGGVVLTDAVNVTGPTTGNTYVLISQ